MSTPGKGTLEERLLRVLDESAAGEHLDVYRDAEQVRKLYNLAKAAAALGSEAAEAEVERLRGESRIFADGCVAAAERANAYRDERDNLRAEVAELKRTIKHGIEGRTIETEVVSCMSCQPLRACAGYGLQPCTECVRCLKERDARWASRAKTTDETIHAMSATTDQLRAEVERLKAALDARNTESYRTAQPAIELAARAMDGAGQLRALVGELVEALEEELDNNPVGPERTPLIARARAAVSK